MSITIPIAASLVPIIELATEVHLEKGRVLIQQYARAEHFYLLTAGEVSLSLNLEGESHELVVGYSREVLTPIGWSGFNQPFRYTTTVKVSSDTARAFVWDHACLNAFLQQNPQQCQFFLKLICSKSRSLIKEALHLLREYTIPLPQPSISEYHEEFQSTNTSQDEDVIQFLRRSPFFEVFDEKPLASIRACIERRQYRTNDLVYEQGSQADGVFIMVVGKVSFSYYDDQNQYISFRQISTPGFIVGWSGAVDLPNLINAHAVQESVIYFIPKSDLEQALSENSHFASKFYYRLLWLISHQLQAVRARLISAKYNHEIVAISNLIEQNSTRLELTSALHKVPHLLGNKLTIGDGIETLHWLKGSGTTLEKNIVALSLDILQEIKKEQKFFSGLIKVYDTVVNSPDHVPPAEVRAKSAEVYTRLFDDIPYIISGRENLPSLSGNIFIYNHLRNHPFNTLPNQFQLTLDSHFISSMILYKEYGDPGIRIVRIGRGAEYAHQEYYQRLGHIDVYTNESNPLMNQPTQREERRRLFYQEAGKHLKEGRNLIISPEGTSYSTEESPGPLKSGAFRLALGLDPEPLIVPIAIANFDKRIRNNRFTCIILPPFKVSDYIRDPLNKQEMKQFLIKYQKEFRTNVEDAIALSENTMI